MATHFLFLYWQCCFDWEENVWKLKFLFLAKKLDQFWFSVVAIARLPFARHYKPRLVYFLTPFLKTISLFSRRFFQKILSLCMASVQERLIMARVWYFVTLAGHFIFKIGDSTSIILQLPIHSNVNATLLCITMKTNYIVTNCHSNSRPNRD